MSFAPLAVLAGVPNSAGQSFDSPTIDWHAIAPEIVLLGVAVVLLLFDLFFTERARPLMPALSGIGCLAVMIPILTLHLSDAEVRPLFGGAYVVDDFALVLKALFVLTTYVVILLSTNYIAEGDYWENEYYFLVLSAVLGMMVMASARDLVSIFVALELLSIPAYMLAAWRKRDAKSNEAGLKYYLMGVFASAVMLYGMSIIYGVTGSTILSEIGAALRLPGDEGLVAGNEAVVTLAIVFVVVGFGFKVSAVPFHTWSPDTYEGAPTPVTAFLATASKAAGFVALMILVAGGFFGRDDVVQWLFWVLAIVTMTVGNLIALRQTNVVRLMAYSGVAQAGYILAPLAVVGTSAEVTANAIGAIVTYLLIYAAMNLGVFAVIIAAARRTGSAESRTFAGLIQWAPGLAVAMTLFLFALAGIPPLGGWFAKFAIFFAVVGANTWQAYVLGGFIAVNSVVALFYYANIARLMWMEPVPEDLDQAPLRTPISLNAALAITAALTLLFGILPSIVADFGDAAAVLALPLP